MRLYFVRHAQSSNNVLMLKTNSRRDRSPDPLLSDLGQAQVKYLANFLRDAVEPDEDTWFDAQDEQDFEFTHIYCSLMRRAVETAAGVSRALGVPMIGWRDLHETGGIVAGDGEEIAYRGLPGSPRSFFSENYPEMRLADDFGEEGWWNQPHEDERLHAGRARRVVDTLLYRHGATQDRVLVVTHGAFYNHLMQVLLELEDENVMFGWSNTAITRWDFRPQDGDETRFDRVLVYSNRVDHLPRNLVTM